MNMKLAIVSGIALIAASTSFAESLAEYPDFSNVVSTKTRAEVIAELEAARADGTLQVLNSEYPIIKQSAGPRRTREEVLTELRQFRAEHPYDNSDLNYPAALYPTPEKQRFAGMETSPPAR